MDPNLSQALHLLNGSTVEGKISEGGVLKKLAKSGRPRGEIIDELYLRCFSRKPTEVERVKLLSFFEGAKSDEQVLGDLFWSLLNAKEFVFNH